MTSIPTAMRARQHGSASVRQALMTMALALTAALAMTITHAPQAHAYTAISDTKLAAAPAVVGASTAPNFDASADPCGYWVKWRIFAYYNHCGPENICIRVAHLGLHYNREVPEGNTYLGLSSLVRGAWYIRLPPCDGVTP